MATRSRLVCYLFITIAVLFVNDGRTLAGQPASNKNVPLSDPLQGLPWNGGRDDPIGFDRSDEALDKVRQTRIGAGGDQDAGANKESARKIPAGEVLTALSSVRESQHQTSVRFSSGLAIVTETMRFIALSDVPAELCYRQAVPDDASLASVQACNLDTCKPGVVDPPLSPQQGSACGNPIEDTRGLGPAARVALRSDARGRGAMVRAARVKKGDVLTVNVQYLVGTEQHQGVTRLRLPPRGSDARAANTEARISDAADQRGTGTVNGSDSPLTLEPWVPLEFAQRSSEVSIQTQAWQFPCNGKQCARVRVSAPPQPAVPVDLVLAIDVSPSTFLLSQTRIATAIALLLTAVPAQSRVRALAFAARPKILVKDSTDAMQITLSSLTANVSQSDVGSTTRLEAAWQTAEAWFARSRHAKLRPLIVVIGDGGITESKDSPFNRIKRAGVEVSVLNIADRPTNAFLQNGAALTGGISVDAGIEADHAANGRGTEPFEERVAALFAPVVTRRIWVDVGKKTIDLGTLRAGEERVWEGITNGTKARVTWAKNRIRASEPPKDMLLALASRAIHAATPPIGLAQLKKDETKLGAGMPAGPLLSMLRQRVIPIARGCFRKDRAGRANYRQRAVFVLRLSDQEVTYTDIEGAVKRELKQCLLVATDGLEVPRFSGTVLVRYPLVTEAEPTIQPIELAPEVEKQLKAITDTASAAETTRTR